MNLSFTRQSPRGLLRDAIFSGSSASLASAGALAIYSKLETGSAAAGMNGPSQWIWGVRAAKTDRPSLKHTALGYVIHHGTSIFWAVLYERFLGRRARTRRLSALQIAAEAAATAAGAYLVDYKLTPRRFQPGFEQHVSAQAMFATYAAFAAGLALVTILRRR